MCARACTEYIMVSSYTRIEFLVLLEIKFLNRKIVHNVEVVILTASLNHEEFQAACVLLHPFIPYVVMVTKHVC